MKPCRACSLGLFNRELCDCDAIGPQRFRDCLPALVRLWLTQPDVQWRIPVIDPHDFTLWLGPRDWTKRDWRELVATIRRQVWMFALDDCDLCSEDDRQSECRKCAGTGSFLDGPLPRIVSSFPGDPDAHVCGGCGHTIGLHETKCLSCDNQLVALDAPKRPLTAAETWHVAAE
jgi:hypothetical protein